MIVGNKQAISGIILVIVVSSVLYAYDRKHTAEGILDFHVFAPSVNFEGLTISDASLDSHTLPPSQGATSATSLVLTLRNGSRIAESRATAGGFQYQCYGTVKNGSCAVNKTPKEQQYLLTTYTGKEQDIDWVRDGTMIHGTLTIRDSALDNDTLGKFIDSFMPKTYKGLPVHKTKDWTQSE